MSDSVSDTQTTSATDAQDPSTSTATPQNAVGTLLRENRRRAGLDIADVARVLRISQKYLQALEEGRCADLPGMPYAIGFVRSYAEHLHLDGEEIVRRYKVEAAGAADQTDLVFPKPIPDGGVPGAAVLGLGVIFAAVAYGVWYWNTTSDEAEIARVEPVPGHMAAPAPEKSTVVETVVAPMAETAVEPTSGDDMSPTSEDIATQAPEDGTTVAVAETQPVAQEPPVIEESASETVEDGVEQVVADVAEPEPETSEDVSVISEDTRVSTSPSGEEAMGEDVNPQGEAPVDQSEEETTVAATTITPETAAPETAISETGPAETAQPVSEEPEAVDAAAESPAPETAVDEAPVAAVAAVLASRENVGPSRITVRAKSNSWIQVRDEIADRLLFTRLLREGDEYEVPNRSGLRLMTGNAGALELLVDGDAVPDIGGAGEVRRNVELDADKLKSGSAVSE